MPIHGARLSDGAVSTEKLGDGVTHYLEFEATATSHGSPGTYTLGQLPSGYVTTGRFIMIVDEELTLSDLDIFVSLED